MKTLILMAVLSLSTLAHASYFQTECSDARQNIKYNHGQMDNSLTVTVNSIDGESVPMTMDLSNLEIENKSETNIKYSNVTQCNENGGGAAFISSTDVFEIVITSLDGSGFPAETRGLSEDGKSIEATIVCEHQANYLASCQPQPELQ